MIECYNNACPMHSVHNQKDPDKEPLCVEKLCVLDKVKLDPAKLAVCKSVESSLGTCGVSLDEFRRYMEVRQEQVYLVWTANDVRDCHKNMATALGRSEAWVNTALWDTEVRDILDIVSSQHDAEQGVSYLTLEAHIMEYLGGSK